MTILGPWITINDGSHRRFKRCSIGGEDFVVFIFDTDDYQFVWEIWHGIYDGRRCISNKILCYGKTSTIDRAKQNADRKAKKLKFRLLKQNYASMI